MECSKCKEIKERMPRRTICRSCYNAEKVIQRKNCIINKDKCTKCLQTKTIPKGKTWCKECKNDYEKLRKSKFTESKKEEEKQKNHNYYKNIKENVKEIIIDINKTKICTVCNKDKTLDKYYVAKCKGIIRPQCKDCTSKKRNEYYQNNKQQTIKQTSNYKVKRCKTDPEFKILQTLRCRLYHALINQKVDKLYKTKQLTGCNLPFLKGYLEAKFTEGMTWENHGKWHIDHIKPCCSFDLNNDEEQKKCFYYTNLQPLWAKDNLSKGGKYEANIEN
jgi:hypothetical protein